MRALVIANSGQALASMTSLLVELKRVDLRHASGATHVDRQVRSFAPRLVLIDDMRWPPLALARIQEVRSAAPDAAIVVTTAELEGDWLAEALRLGADAVLPADADSEMFLRILDEVLAPQPLAA
jgi:DNA-binding NarL/FixJ family response regulator